MAGCALSSRFSVLSTSLTRQTNTTRASCFRNSFEHPTRTRVQICSTPAIAAGFCTLTLNQRIPTRRAIKQLNKTWFSALVHLNNKNYKDGMQQSCYLGTSSPSGFKSSPPPPRATLCNAAKSTSSTEENVETKFRKTWVHHMHVPHTLRPYLLLARVDRPIGTWLLLWPCYWSIALASSGSVTSSIPLMALFGCGAILMRGAGCTFNDMVDKDIDVKVARTRTRPIASGMLTQNQGVAFLGVQLAGALAVLLSLNNYSIVLGASSLLIVASYPFMKRITWYPQAWLGLAFNWGALLGWSSVHASLYLPVVLPLYIAGISWTIVYDTIYAHMDKSDDVFLGIGSTAIKFGEKNRLILSSFGIACITALLASGYAADQTFPYYMAISAAACHLAWQISTINFENNSDCMRKFLSNKWFGAIIFVGILAVIAFFHAKFNSGLHASYNTIIQYLNAVTT